MSLGVHVDRYLPLIEDEIEDLLVSDDELSAYYGMMHYHLGWLDEHLQPVPDALRSQGKRLRPVLCLLACEAVGGQIERALPAAAAIELVHNFSLIHDDIEDMSATRRHRATVWKLWGPAQAINCGDGMFAAALLKMGQLPDRGVPAERALYAMRAFCRTCLDLTEGQYMDMTFEGEMDVDLDRYLWMIRNKSAALIACSAHLGAYLGGADAETVRSYARFGENLGMAFQVIDDIIGIWGVEDVTGKSASTDILSRKKTLPVVYALGDPVLRRVYRQETVADEDVPEVIAILERVGARAFAEQTAKGYSEQAMADLARAGADTRAGQAIAELTHALLGGYLRDSVGGEPHPR